MNDALTTIREAVPADVPRLLELVQELADFERMPSAVEATADHFHRALFPDDNVSARGHALVAEVLTPQGPQVVGMAVWYVTFSTWLGRHGLWLEDLYVSPTQRGAGLGQALLSRLAQIAVQRDYGRVEWRVLGTTSGDVLDSPLDSGMGFRSRFPTSAPSPSSSMAQMPWTGWSSARRRSIDSSASDLSVITAGLTPMYCLTSQRESMSYRKSASSRVQARNSSRAVLSLITHTSSHRPPPMTLAPLWRRRRDR
jgi:GNAT superfamily N-acetyltransferase